MQPLGDFLPQEIKEQLAESNFKIGTVLKYHVVLIIRQKKRG